MLDFILRQATVQHLVRETMFYEIRKRLQHRQRQAMQCGPGEEVRNGIHDQVPATVQQHQGVHTGGHPGSRRAVLTNSPRSLPERGETSVQQRA